MYCKNCAIPMIGTMSFSKNKHEKFMMCPKCRGETKHQRFRDDDLNFGEVLDRKIKKLKNNNT